MDMNKISIVLNEMHKYKNYQDFVNLLSFEERRYLFNNLLNIADNYPLFNDDNILQNFFNKEEVNLLYESINELTDVEKTVLGMNASDNLKKEIAKHINDDYSKKELIISLEKDEDKMEFIDDINDASIKFSLVCSLKSAKYKLEYIKKQA